MMRLYFCNSPKSHVWRPRDCLEEVTIKSVIVTLSTVKCIVYVQPSVFLFFVFFLYVADLIRFLSKFCDFCVFVMKIQLVLTFLFLFMVFSVQVLIVIDEDFLTNDGVRNGLSSS